jgi:hypothetical protein
MQVIIGRVTIMYKQITNKNRTIMKRILLCGLILASVFPSCTNKDLYDEEKDAAKKQEEYENNFPVKNLDPDQDWCTFAAVKANVTVNEDALETYTVKLYSANPMDEEANPLLLAKSEVKNGETSSFTIEIPKDLKSVWAVRLDKHNRCLFKQGAVTDGVVNITFGNKSSNTRATIATTRTIIAPELPYTDKGVNAMATKATAVPDDGKVDSKGTYVVKSDAKISDLTASGGAVIIVQGEVEGATVTGGAQLILNGSKAKLSGDVEVNGGALLYVMPGSTFTINGLAVQSDSKVYLKGIDNKESEIKTLTADATSTFINYYGRLVMETVTAANLENYCYIELTSQNTSTINNLKMGQHSYLSAKELQSTADGNTSGKDKKGDWYLDDFSVIDVKSNFKAIRTDISGPEGYNYALLRIRGNYEYNVEGTSDKGINVGYLCNNIYVELAPTSVGKDSSVYKLTQGMNGAGEVPGQVTHGNGNATLTLLHNAPVYIAPSECSGEGNTPGGGGDMPEDKKMAYTFAFEDLGDIGDYDFNDVVLQITDGEDKYHFNVYIAAAGGTLPVKVELKNAEKGEYITLWEEVHSAFGVSQSTMVNTGKGTTVAILPKKENLYKDCFADRLYSNAEFRITVTNGDGTKESEIISAPKKGSAPQCLRIAGDWKWPVERARITEAYPGFADWAQSSTGTGWTKNPVSEYIYK